MQNGAPKRQIYCAVLLLVVEPQVTSNVFCMVKPLKKFQSIPCFILDLGRLEASWGMPDDLMDELEAFRRALYGNSRTTSVNELHYIKLTHLCDSTASTPEALQTYLHVTDDWSSRSNV